MLHVRQEGEYMVVKRKIVYLPEIKSLSFIPEPVILMTEQSWLIINILLLLLLQVSQTTLFSPLQFVPNFWNYESSGCLVGSLDGRPAYHRVSTYTGRYKKRKTEIHIHALINDPTVQEVETVQALPDLRNSAYVISDLRNSKKKQTFLKRMPYLPLQEWKQWDKNDRILLSDNTGGRAIALWLIRFQCVGIWISTGLCWIYI